MVKPNLAPGVVIDGNLLLKLSGQGSVYIRSLEPLWNDEESNALDDWHDQLDSSSNLVQCEQQPQVAVPLSTNEVVSSPEPLPEIERVTGVLMSDDNRCTDGHCTDLDTTMTTGN